MAVIHQLFNKDKPKKKQNNSQIISSTITKSSKKRKANEIPRDFGFNPDRLAHGGINFALVRKSLRNRKKTLPCLKKVLRNYEVS